MQREIRPQLAAAVAVDAPPLVDQVRRIGDDEVERSLRAGEHIAVRDTRLDPVQLRVRAGEAQRDRVHVQELHRTGARREEQASGAGAAADVGHVTGILDACREERREPVRIGPEEDGIG